MASGPAVVLPYLIAALAAAPLPAYGGTDEEEAWLDGLGAAVVGDLAAGKPLVVQVHVPLCDNDILRCGNERLGDGDNPATNLYWSTTPGFGYWFNRRRSGWEQVLDGDGDTVGEPHVLDVRVYRRTLHASKAWQRAGAPATFEVYLVAEAWRGSAIDLALDAYAADLYGATARPLTLDDGTVIDAGGAARIVAYAGHNRLMDLDAYAWPEPAVDAPVKGTMAIACHTAAYMQATVPGETRVPLLLTRDFLFANAAPLEGALLAFAEGGGYARIRRAAAEGYARPQKREVKKVTGLFTNPADRRWQKAAAELSDE